jgi:hypothetical protein
MKTGAEEVATGFGYGPATTNTGFCGSGVPFEKVALSGAGNCSSMVSLNV